MYIQRWEVIVDFVIITVQIKSWGEGVPLTDLTPPPFCACPKPGPGFTTSSVMVFNHKSEIKRQTIQWPKEKRTNKYQYTWNLQIFKYQYTWNLQIFKYQYTWNLQIFKYQYTWNLQVLSVFWFLTYDYPFGIYKLFLCLFHTLVVFMYIQRWEVIVDFVIITVQIKSWGEGVPLTDLTPTRELQTDLRSEANQQTGTRELPTYLRSEGNQQTPL
jgi:hypothetical protein